MATEALQDFTVRKAQPGDAEVFLSPRFQPLCSKSCSPIPTFIV
jgi:hypothetical protein